MNKRKEGGAGGGERGEEQTGASPRATLTHRCQAPEADFSRSSCAHAGVYAQVCAPVVVVVVNISGNIVCCAWVTKIFHSCAKCFIHQILRKGC